jgi:hypothetical protein
MADLIQQSSRPEFSAEIGLVAMAPQAAIAQLIKNGGLAPQD